MRRILLISLVFIFLSSNKEAQGQQYWTLEKSISHAMESNISVEQSQLNINAAEKELDFARQQRYPDLSGSASVRWNFGRSIDPITNDFITQTFFSNNYSINSGMTLFNGFSITRNIKQSQVDLQARRQDIQQIKQNIALEVANAFLQVLFTQENIEIAERQLDLNEQQLDQISRSIDAGATPASERLNVETQVLQSQQRLIEAQNNFDIAFLQLKQLLRLPPDEDMEIVAPENVNVSIDPDQISFKEAMATAKEVRPELQAAQLNLQSAELGVDIAKSSYYPSLFAGASIGTVYSNNPFVNQDFTTQIDHNLSYGFGAQLSIPIYERGRAKTDVAMARINVENTQLEYQLLLENLQTNVQQAIANARAAKKALEASTKALQAQEQSFANTTKRLEIGATNTFEWEAQKTELENAEFQQVIDKYNYLFNIKVLEFLLGKPLKL